MASDEAHERLHIVAVPYPGRGHINPMLNLCRHLAARGAAVTFVVTEEWLDLLGEATLRSLPPTIRPRTIPNVIPSEHGRASNFTGFVEAVLTKMAAPFEQLLDALEENVSAILADTYLPWVDVVGERQGVPVCSLCTMCTTLFSALHHFENIFGGVEDCHRRQMQSEEMTQRLQQYCPGMKLSDFNSIRSMKKPLTMALPAFSSSRKVQCLLFTCCHELEPTTIDSLKQELRLPVYPVGPSIPFMFLEDTASNGGAIDHYFSWLDSQLDNSVLYVSLGSFLSVSAAEMEELVAGLRESGTKFLWVARGESSRFQDIVGETGMVVPWCDQLKVLCHPAIGGFMTHCGWNSTLEGAFAGKPMLALPIFFDQPLSSRLVTDVWKIGLNVREEANNGGCFTREDVVKVVKKLMSSDSAEAAEMRRAAAELSGVVQASVGEDGSSYNNIGAFIEDLKKGF